MKKNLASVLTFGLFIVSSFGFASAQSRSKTVSTTTRDLYVISAKAGGVNYVEGKVAVARKNKTSGYLLKGDTLEVGDKVSTGADGKAEILLNPGSYLRLAENSNFEFVTTSLDNLQLKLSSGSAMLEVITVDEFKVAVNTPKAHFYIGTSGVYRVSVLEDGSGKIAVWKGKAQIGDVNASAVKGGKEAVVKDNQAAIAKFDRDEKDSLETWSKTRAKDLAKVNSRLQRQDLRNTLLYGFGSSRLNVYDSFGLWVFDRSFGSFCFLPFGYGWSSPYGYNYGRDLWYFQLPGSVYNQPPSNSGGTGTTVANHGGRTKTIIDSPPFERVKGRLSEPVDTNYGNTQFPNMSPPTRSEAPPSRSEAPSTPVRIKQRIGDN